MLLNRLFTLTIYCDHQCFENAVVKSKWKTLGLGTFTLVFCKEVLYCVVFEVFWKQLKVPVKLKITNFFMKYCSVQLSVCYQFHFKMQGCFIHQIQSQWKTQVTATIYFIRNSILLGNESKYGSKNHCNFQITGTLKMQSVTFNFFLLLIKK